MHSTLQRIIAEHTQLLNHNKALKWLLELKVDSELALIICCADDHESLDDLLIFIAWALERGMLIAPDDDSEDAF
jgi:hypothetical protein